MKKRRSLGRIKDGTVTAATSQRADYTPGVAA